MHQTLSQLHFHCRTQKLVLCSHSLVIPCQQDFESSAQRITYSFQLIQVPINLSKPVCCLCFYPTRFGGEVEDFFAGSLFIFGFYVYLILAYRAL